MKFIALTALLVVLAFGGAFAGSFIVVGSMINMVDERTAAIVRAESAERSLASITAERDQLRREKAERVAAQAKVGKR